MKQSTWDLIDKAHEGIEGFVRATGPALTDEEISAASAELGIDFPADYREFLLRLGAATIGQFHIFGLRRTEVCPNLLVERNRFYRRQGWPGISDWLILTDDGTGNPVGIARDGRVLCVDHNRGFAVEEWGRDFEDFIRRACRNLVP